MFNPRRLYTLCLWLLLPYIFFHLLWRARKQPEYLRHVAERFGFYKARPARPLIWLHTVSVGETRAVASLIAALREKYPTHQLLLTHTTPTGRAAGEQLYGNEVLRAYLPYDYPFAVRRFLQYFRPQIGILLETEIWFNLIHLCHAQKIPLLLLNARLSDKSAAGYGRFPKLIQAGLRELSVIAAQNDADAAHLAALGATEVSVMGNLKFDIAPPPSMLELGRQLRQQFGRERRIFLAASTRAGEEALLLASMQQLQIPGLLVVIVPRHPQRFDEVAALLTQHDIRFQRRSDNCVIDDNTAVVLGDSMGEMFAYYAACDVAFIGGSLLPFGGQNLIEACALGKPVIIGPHTFNFDRASHMAIASGAAVRVQDSDELAQSVHNLFTDTARAAEMGHAGLRFVNNHRGATTQALLHINQFLA